MITVRGPLLLYNSWPGWAGWNFADKNGAAIQKTKMENVISYKFFIFIFRFGWKNRVEPDYTDDKKKT